eukprot:UN02708
MNLGEAQQRQEELQYHEDVVNNTKPKTFQEQQAQFQAIRQEKKQREQYQQQESWEHCDNDEVVPLPKKNAKYQQYAPPEIKPLTSDAARRLYSNPTASINNSCGYSNQYHTNSTNHLNAQNLQQDQQNNNTISFATIDKPKTNAEYALELAQQRQFQREQWKERRAAMHNNTANQNLTYNKQNAIQQSQSFRNNQQLQPSNNQQYDISARERNRDYTSNIIDSTPCLPPNPPAYQNQLPHPTTTTTTQQQQQRLTTKSLFGNKNKNQAQTTSTLQPPVANQSTGSYIPVHQHVPP